MKLTVWTIGLSLTSGLFPVGWLVASASAQCLQADVSVQYNISGSREPTDRTSNVEMSHEGSCQGNASITTGVQGNIGGNGRVSQRRVVRHRLNNSLDNSEDLSNSTVRVQSNPAIDVYNPADNLDY